jgi:hypothetical protein
MAWTRVNEVGIDLTVNTNEVDADATLRAVADRPTRAEMESILREMFGRLYEYSLRVDPPMVIELNLRVRMSAEAYNQLQRVLRELGVRIP